MRLHCLGGEASAEFLRPGFASRRNDKDAGGMVPVCYMPNCGKEWRAQGIVSGRVIENDG